MKKAGLAAEQLHKGVENIFGSVEHPQPAFGWGFSLPGRISCQVLRCHVSLVFPEVN